MYVLCSESLKSFLKNFYEIIIDFETNLIFLIKPLSYMTEKSRQKFLENEKSFKGEIKSFFLLF